MEYTPKESEVVFILNTLMHEEAIDIAVKLLEKYETDGSDNLIVNNMKKIINYHRFEKKGRT